MWIEIWHQSCVYYVNLFHEIPPLIEWNITSNESMVCTSILRCYISDVWMMWVNPQVLLCCYMKYHQRCEKRCVACNVVPKYKGPFPRYVVGILGMLCCGHIFMDQLTLGEWYGHYHIGHHCFSRTSLWCPIYTGSTWQLGSVYKGRSESKPTLFFTGTFYSKC